MDPISIVSAECSSGGYRKRYRAVQSNCVRMCFALASSLRERNGDPNGIRTRVTAVKGRCPRPLDDRVLFGRTGRIRQKSRAGKQFSSSVQELSRTTALSTPKSNALLRRSSIRVPSRAFAVEFSLPGIPSRLDPIFKFRGAGLRRNGGLWDHSICAPLPILQACRRHSVHTDRVFPEFFRSGAGRNPSG